LKKKVSKSILARLLLEDKKPSKPLRIVVIKTQTWFVELPKPRHVIAVGPMLPKMAQGSNR